MEIGGFSLFSLLSVGLAGIGCLFHVIGLSVIYWIVTDPFISGLGQGLWQMCYPNKLLVVVCSSYSYTPDYWKATQAFVIIGFLIGVGAFVLSIVSLIKKVKNLRLLSFIGCFCAAASILLAITIFGDKTAAARDLTHHQLGWGFILSTVSAFFFIAGGIMGWLDNRASE